MRLVCISDTHGDHERLDLPPGDVLVHAGDLSAHGKDAETQAFMRWFGHQDYRYRICVAGNHDSFVEQQTEKAASYATENGVTLLNDSGCDVNGVRFWGSPITPRFYHWSFMRDPGEPIEQHWRMIPADTQVLITHGPPFGIMDQVNRDDGSKEHTGCPSLLDRLAQVKPKVHIFGHIHECHGQHVTEDVNYYNVSSMNEHYQIAHGAVIIDL